MYEGSLRRLTEKKNKVKAASTRLLYVGWRGRRTFDVDRGDLTSKSGWHSKILGVN